MGVYKEVHVGPYVRAVNTIVEIEVVVKSCDNKECASAVTRGQPSGSFCQHCGEKIKDIKQKKQEDKVNPFELADQGNLAYLRLQGEENRTNVFAENRTYCARKMYLGEEGDGEFAVSASDIEDEMKAFREVFKKEIGDIEDAYGKHNVTILWGVVEYSS